MAVQKTKVSTSRRGMRRSHDKLNKVNVVENSTTGTPHRTHHVSADGYYKGRKVTDSNVNT